MEPQYKPNLEYKAKEKLNKEKTSSPHDKQNESITNYLKKSPATPAASAATWSSASGLSGSAASAKGPATQEQKKSATQTEQKAKNLLEETKKMIDQIAENAEMLPIPLVPPTPVEKVEKPAAEQIANGGGSLHQMTQRRSSKSSRKKEKSLDKAEAKSSHKSDKLQRNSPKSESKTPN